MAKVTELASGQINASDSISIELVEAEETPAVVLLRWPPQPSVATPVRFGATASAVTAMLAAATARLAAIRATGL